MSGNKFQTLGEIMARLSGTKPQRNPRIAIGYKQAKQESARRKRA